MASPVEAEDSGSEDAVLSSEVASEEEEDSAEVLLQLVRDNGGFLPLNDDSAPEEVARMTQMSKKVFKRSLGMLLKRGEVEMTEQGIKLRKGK